MAVRLHLKPGLVAAADRLPTSPDTVVVVEPTIGSISRSKGNLYAIVTGRPGSGSRAAEATRLVAETIERQFYYDESAGIPVCLEKAVRSANQRLRHGRESHGLAPGGVGAAVAVVRGHELYVATIGDADAFLVRQARLLTLPEDDRGAGLPAAGEVEVDVWRGDMVVGDTLILSAHNVTTTVGLEEIKNAAVTLHPQSAAEHLHHLFVAGGGEQSDALMVMEAAEMPATRTDRKLTPVRAAEPLAGAPDRSPIPLADPLVGAASAVQGGARVAREAVSGAAAGAMEHLTDLLPRRRTSYRRVVPLADRTASQRRVAIAFLGFLVLLVALAGVVWFIGGLGHPNVAAVSNAQQAIQAATDDMSQVTNGNLLVNEPTRAHTILQDAWHQLVQAAAFGAPASSLADLKGRVSAALDQLYDVSYTTSQVLLTLDKIDATPDLQGLIVGPDGAAYLIDTANGSVIRVDLAARTARVVVQKGQKGIAAPRLLTTAGPDVLIVDAAQGLWRWAPSDAKGDGTLARLSITAPAPLAPDVTAIAAYLRNFNTGLYNFYTVDPAAQQIVRYQPTAAGGGYVTSSNYLTAPTDLTGVHDMDIVDGYVFTLSSDGITRYFSGQASSFSLDVPPDQGDMRPGHDYRLLNATGAAPTDRLWVWDASYARILEFSRTDGSYIGQFLVADGGSGFVGLRGMAVVLGKAGQPPALVWITAAQVMVSPLAAVSGPGVSPSPSASPSPSPHATPRPTAKPKATPKR